MKKEYNWAGLGICTAAMLSFSAQAGTSPGKMNVVFILADDLGWSDVTLYGTTKFYETPNLERLAARGMTFTRAYSASPLSSPTRATILTGQTAARTGITTPNCHSPQTILKPTVAANAPVGNKALLCVSATRLNTNLPTLGKLVKAEGYQTGHFGKWHLGPEPYSPLQHGFDVDIPHWPGPGPAGSYVAPWRFPNFPARVDNEHIEERMTAEAIDWLRHRDTSKPFFMNYWEFSVHAPFDARRDLIKLYRERVDLNSAQRSAVYAAMVHSMDDAVGALLDEIDRQGIADNTIIVFFSDNGGNMYNGVNEITPDGTRYVAQVTSNAPLRGGKATMFEGGVRVPCVIVWPGVTKPGSRSDVPIQSTDFYPTLLHALGIELPKNHVVDGKDIKPVLQGDEHFSRGPIYTYFPHAPKVPDWLPPAVSVHDGDWKLIRIFYEGENGEHKYLLYNLKDDISEQHDLSDRYPKKVKELDRLIDKHLDDAHAVQPKPNPKFNPAKYNPSLIGVQQGGLKVGGPLIETD